MKLFLFTIYFVFIAVGMQVVYHAPGGSAAPSAPLLPIALLKNDIYFLQKSREKSVYLLVYVI